MNKKDITIWDYFLTIKNKIPQTYLYTFVTSVITFFVVHFYIFSDKFYNNDDGIYNVGGAGITSGRWFLHFVCGFSSNWCAPWLTGLFCAVYLGVGICFVVGIYKLKNKFSIFLVVLSMISFPVIADQNRYLFTVDAYMFALMLVCAGVFVTVKYKYGFIIGAALYAMSLGIYQAYFCFAVPLLMLMIILRLLKKEIPLKDTVRFGMKAVISLLAGLVTYKIILDALLKFYGAKLSDYMGINGMLDFTIKDIILRIGKAYVYFGGFYLQKVYNFYGENNISKWWLILFVCLTLLMMYLTFERKRDFTRIIFLEIVCLLLPLGCGIIMVMSEEVHGLMIYGFVFPLVIGVVLCDVLKINIENNIKKYFTSVVSFIIILCIISINYNNVIAVNAAYEKLETTHEVAYAFVTKLSARIEMTEGYDQELPVLIVGEIPKDRRPIIQDATVQDLLDEIYHIPNVENALSGEKTKQILQFYLGITYLEPSEEQTEFLINSDTVKAMPLYPAKDSILVKDDVIIVKFGE